MEQHKNNVHMLSYKIFSFLLVTLLSSMTSVKCFLKHLFACVCDLFYAIINFFVKKVFFSEMT